MKYIIHYDVAAIFITVATALHFYIRKNIKTQQNEIFKCLMAFEFFSSILDLVTIYLIEHSDMVSTNTHYVLNEIYLIAFNATSAIYFLYIFKVIKKKAEVRWWERLIIAVPITVDVVLISTTSFTGAVFTMEAGNVYTHGKFFWILYLNALLYVGASQVYSMRYKSFFTVSQVVAVYFYTIFSFVAILVQMAIPGLMFTQFAVSIAVLLIYLSLENPLVYSDRELGTYNKTAFEGVVTSLIESDKPFEVLGVEIEGMEYIADTLGVVSANQLLKQFADVLVNISGKRKVFFMNGYRFAIISEDRKNKWDLITSEVYERIAKPFYTDTVSVALTAPMCVVSYPENAKRLSDIVALINAGLKESNMNAGNEVIYADDEILEKGRRENEIIQIMKSAIRENKFEVYYQPIYSVEEERYTSAEALVRLQHGELGYISPEEFIPIAEKHGLILDIGEFVFEEVCRFIRDERLLRKGIEYIDVNLSVVQCMQDNLHEKLLEIMDKYNVPCSAINLEITETAAVMSHESLLKNMDALMAHGVCFALDDYGTGYANTSAVIQYPFSTVKLDKSMLWSAFEDKKAMSALKFSIAMIKEMGMKIITEGVENEEQSKLLKSMGCDYFQGYYYSKAVSGAEFLKKIEPVV
jgi:EAL domain-containing protein (putative c-di-GMP-specific phosphodiesterase class I)/GGDEF domain-containing protein